MIEYYDSETPAVSQQAEMISKEEEAARTSNDEEQLELSTEDIDAISQLTSPDPVQKEREELQRIKDAMMADVAEETPSESLEKREQPDDDVTVDEEERSRQVDGLSALGPNEPVCTATAQEEAFTQTKELEDAIEKKEQQLNIISMDGDVPEGEAKSKENSSEDNSVIVSEQEGVGDVK